jgi:hypothetical protein
MPLDAESFDPYPILERLAEAGVDFVVIGGVAGGAHGSSFATFDLDLAYARDPKNLEKLAALLVGLGATLRGAPENVPFILDAETLARGANFTFTTSLGSLDILGDPAGAPPYEKLREAATVIELGMHAIRVASLDHLIAMKEAAGRPKDKGMAAEYRLLADELRDPDRP